MNEEETRETSRERIDSSPVLLARVRDDRARSLEALERARITMARCDARLSSQRAHHLIDSMRTLLSARATQASPRR